MMSRIPMTPPRECSRAIVGVERAFQTGEAAWSVALMAMTLRRQQFSDSQLRAGTHRVDASFAGTVLRALPLFRRADAVGVIAASQPAGPSPASHTRAAGVPRRAGHAVGCVQRPQLTVSATTSSVPSPRVPKRPLWGPAAPRPSPSSSRCSTLRVPRGYSRLSSTSSSPSSPRPLPRLPTPPCDSSPLHPAPRRPRNAPPRAFPHGVLRGGDAAAADARDPRGPRAVLFAPPPRPPGPPGRIPAGIRPVLCGHAQGHRRRARVRHRAGVSDGLRHAVGVGDAIHAGVPRPSRRWSGSSRGTGRTRRPA